jgi:uncharacterized protein YihD (DUF1040 family)
MLICVTEIGLAWLIFRGVVHVFGNLLLFKHFYCILLKLLNHSKAVLNLDITNLIYTMNRESARRAVQELLNDVIEQGFHHLLRHPQQGDGLNQIIKDATDEMNRQLLQIDERSKDAALPALSEHYREVIRDTENKSLHLLSRLQKIQQIDNPRLKRV